jgi:adenosine/AMP kinase
MFLRPDEDIKAEIVNDGTEAPVKAVPEVCTVFCATANPVDVLVAATERGRGIVGVIDGSLPLGIERSADVAARHRLLRTIGYKL